MKPIPRSSIQAFTVPDCAFAKAVPGPAPGIPGCGVATAPKHFDTIALFFCWSQPGSNDTCAPTWREVPSLSALLWTKRSSPPVLGEMKPMPRCSIHAFTVPVCRSAGAAGAPPATAIARAPPVAGPVLASAPAAAFACAEAAAVSAEVTPVWAIICSMVKVPAEGSSEAPSMADSPEPSRLSQPLP